MAAQQVQLTAGRDFTLGNGATVFSEGDPSDVAYRILEGAVELTIESDDGPVRVATLQAGELFGELGVIDGKARSATARALGPVVLRAVDRDELFQSFNANPAAALPLIEQLARRLRETDRLLAERPDAPELLEGGRGRRGWGGLRWLGALRRLFVPRAERAAGDAGFRPAWLEIEEGRSPVLIGATLYCLAGLVVTAITWASLARLDRVVAAPARLITSAPEIALQPFEAGMVRQILVVRGERVRKGQVLAVLDPTFAEADVASARNALAAREAQSHRLGVELAGTVPAGALPPSFSDHSAYDALQRESFEIRRREYGAQIAVFETGLGEVAAQRDTLIRTAATIEGQLANLDELVSMRQTAQRSGAGSRLNLLEANNDRLVLQRELDQTRGRLVELERQAATTGARRDQYASDWRARASTELLEVVRERDRLREEVRKMERRSTLISLTAPADAVVLDIAERAVGSVLREAEALIRLVPTEVPLQLQADVATQDIGYLRAGDPVRIKLEALPFQRHGTIEGRVAVLSENTIAIDTAEGRRPVYRAVIALVENPERSLREVPADFRLIPGMVATAEVRVGDRRVIDYFLYPILRALDEGLREP